MIFLNSFKECVILHKMKQMKTLDQIDFNGKRAVIRVDFNVPLDDAQQVTDETRLKASLPTIQYILDQGGSCVLLSHLGRPKGPQAELSLHHVIGNLENLLGFSVQFSSTTVGAEAEAAAQQLQPGQLLLMENLRFHAEETAGDLDFARQLAALGDVYVNDAFGTAHRAHASTTTMAQFFEGQACAGRLLAAEIEAIDKVLKTGEKPVLAILGGAKVSSKITIIEKMLDVIDDLIIGGGMVYTFAKAQGGTVGNSICEDDYQETALRILEQAQAKNVNVHLPVDVIAAQDFDNNAEQKVFPANQIQDGWEGLDAGPETVEKFKAVVSGSKTILWNGPLGVFEFSNFATGTVELGKSIGEATAAGAFSLVGGGDSVAAAKQFGLAEQMSYVSTGGGAMLESLEGRELPGIKALNS